MATLTSFGKLMDAAAIRNTTETFGTNIVEAQGHSMVAFPVDNGLDQNMDIKVYGMLDAAGTYGSFLWEAATTVAAGTKGYVDVALPSAFPYFRVSAKAGTNPTSGTITIYVNME